MSVTHRSSHDGNLVHIGIPGLTPERPDAHNGGVTAIAWTLVGLMAGSLGVLSAALYSGLGRIDGLGARLDALGARIDAQGVHLGGRIDALGTELRGEIGALRDQVHAFDVRLTRAGG